MYVTDILMFEFSFKHTYVFLWYRQQALIRFNREKTPFISMSVQVYTEQSTMKFTLDRYLFFMVEHISFITYSSLYLITSVCKYQLRITNGPCLT